MDANQASYVVASDVGMVQCHRRSSLALEACEGLSVLRPFFREKFQRHLPAECSILGLVDGTHPAAEFQMNAVVGNRFTIVRDRSPFMLRAPICKSMVMALPYCLNV